MIHKIIKKEIQVPGTLEDTYMETFLLSVTDKFTVQERPLILVCPGGGYNHTSDREAEIVAMQFNAMGYHTAVLRYSCAPAVFPTARESTALIRTGSRSLAFRRPDTLRHRWASSGTQNGLRRSGRRTAWILRRSR